MHSFILHYYRYEGKTQTNLEERLANLKEQKRLDEEAIEQQLKRKELNDECIRKQAELRHDLDMVMEGKKKVEGDEAQRSQVDEERIKIYLKAKTVSLDAKHANLSAKIFQDKINHITLAIEVFCVPPNSRSARTFSPIERECRILLTFFSTSQNINQDGWQCTHAFCSKWKTYGRKSKLNFWLTSKLISNACVRICNSTRRVQSVMKISGLQRW